MLEIFKTYEIPYKNRNAERQTIYNFLLPVKMQTLISLFVTGTLRKLCRHLWINTRTVNIFNCVNLKHHCRKSKLSNCIFGQIVSPFCVCVNIDNDNTSITHIT